ncbi:hypothetical protein ABH924_003742 [Arthrobacter sp. GAS37]
MDGQGHRQGAGPALKALRGLPLWSRAVMTTVTGGVDHHLLPVRIPAQQTLKIIQKSAEKPLEIKAKPLFIQWDKC